MPAIVALADFIDLSAGGVTRVTGEQFEVDEQRAVDLTSGELAIRKRELDAPWVYRPGRILTPLPFSNYAAVSPPEGVRWRQVLHLTYYDPGSSVYRYHSAMNTAPGLISTFGRFYHSNPHCDLRQLDADQQFGRLSIAFTTADVIHVHMDYRTLLHGMKRRPEGLQQLVRHYHGSIFPGDTSGMITFVQNEVDEEYGAIQVAARLYHLRYSNRMHWLPIPMPVADYVQLGRQELRPLEGRPFRLAHSPTVRALKGTDTLVEVVKSLRQKGVDVQLVLIEDKEHGEALHIKASCDATFDSFWLGIQGSGLEAAAMGQAVLAGDPIARFEYIKHVGECPYTFTPDRETLEAELERLVVDPEWRRAEAQRAHDYVRAYHDYPRVAERYLKIVTSTLEARHGAAHG